MLRTRLNWVSTWASEITLTVLIFFIPIFFWSATSELFEFNKITLLYLGAAVLLASEAVRIANLPQPEIVRPRLLIPGLIFLAAMVLATIFSIDRLVSLFGYFDRFHGGLFSWASYAVIYFALTQQPKERLRDLLKINLIAGLVVAAWGISEHLGHSPSCFLLNHSFDDACWVEDVKDRVFATIGQPNWMAGYLAMLLPWGIGLYLSAQDRLGRWAWLGWVVIIYLAFIFTYSRGGSIGLAVAFGLYLILLGRTKIWALRKRLLGVTTLLLVLTIIFATPLTEKVFGQAPPRGIGTVASGNDTGTTRLVVWKGAWEIFNHNPLLGTGLETFGESFYQYRPVEMNTVPEWDYLFNKAHNEYLNYLATTGLVGSLAYLGLLGSFFYLSWRKLHSKTGEYFLVLAALSSVAGYLVQNIFSFTVVPLALIFIFDLTILDWDGVKVLPLRLPRLWLKIKRLHPELLLLITTGLVTLQIVDLWRANVAYANGLGASSVGEDRLAEIELTQAVNLDRWEPNYQIELAMVKASLARSVGVGPIGEKLAGESRAWSERATATSPHNLYLWRRQATALGELDQIDPEYLKLAEQARLKAAALAPTEPKVINELAQFYQSHNKLDSARQYFLLAAELKPNWLDPLLSLTEIELQQNRSDQAKMYLTRARAIAPNDPEVINLSQKVGL